MKIAIQGHLSRGKEVIQIFESLGGKNVEGLTGTYKTFYYIDDKNEIGDDCKKNFPSTYKLYTLEEFEQEFPFKIGDEVIVLDYNNKIGTIVNIKPCGPIFAYFIKLETGDGVYRSSKSLKLYKEMKEERNITLTLEKAKEWYNKGGELKEIALQAFTEDEFTKVELPKTWEEFYKQYKFKNSLNACLDAISTNFAIKYVNKFEAFLKLQYLRDCWRQDWEPNWNDDQQAKYYICCYQGKFKISILYETRRFLSFPTREMAKEFLECFRDLIEKAGDLI